MSETDDGIVDAGKFKEATKASFIEKEEREAEKKAAPKAKKGEYIVAAANLKHDGKKFKRGDAFDGKVYASLLEGKRPALVKKTMWDKADKKI